MATGHQVVLQWAVSTDAAAQYNVFRSATAGTFTGTPLNAAPLAAGTTSYTDTTVTAGNWFYAVESIENGVSSGPSNSVSVSLPPAPPTNLVVESAV